MATDFRDIAIAALDSNNILDSEVRSGYDCTPMPGRLSKMAMYGAGGFCIAFPMKSKSKPGNTLCYRIWWNDAFHGSNAKEISKHVSDMINKLSLPYFVKYEFISSAIRVNGAALPGVKMKWIQEPSLGEWLETNRNNKELIRKLTASFMKMCKDFKEAGIAHGDLSNSNILVSKDAQIHLIDYDSVYVPSMGDRFYQTTLGQPGFQHRDRTQASSKPKMTAKDDNFSQQVIYLSLLAICYDPTLIDSIAKEELLFTQEDLSSETAFIQSRAYKRLSAMNDLEISQRLAELRSAIRGPLQSVRSIVDLVVKLPAPEPRTHVHRVLEDTANAIKSVLQAYRISVTEVTYDPKQAYHKYTVYGPGLKASSIQAISREIAHSLSLKLGSDVKIDVASTSDGGVKIYIVKDPAEAKAPAPAPSPTPTAQNVGKPTTAHIKAKFCHMCGMEFTSDAAKFCSNCGTERLVR